MKTDLSPVVFRGEQTGKLREQVDWLQPLFFAERYDQALLYAGGKTLPVSCVIQGTRVLDMTSPDVGNPDHVALCAILTAEYDDWVCRFSGEPRSVWSFLETGDLYDYEGTGSGERWKRLFQIALDELGFDAARNPAGGQGFCHPRTRPGLWARRSLHDEVTGLGRP